MNEPRLVGLVAENSPDFVRQAQAVWDGGAAFVTLRQADDAQRLRAAAVAEVRVPAPGHGWVDVSFSARQDPGLAQISFTSGTEGEPKGVLLSHANLADVVTRLNSVMGVTNEIREYVGVPVYHSFGFGRCRAVSIAGGRAYLPARGFNPVELNLLLERGEINAISAVPSLWRVLLQTGAVSVASAAKVRWIEIGSQSMAASEKRALCTLFSRAKIVQHYGLTEASRTTFLEVDAASDGTLESVGRAVGRVELRISGDGRIQIRGPHVAEGMLIGGERVDPRDADGWLTTNDRGELQDGYLHFAGRSDDMINCGGLKLAPDALEASIAAQLGGLGSFAVCRILDPVRGDGILVVATAEASPKDEQFLAAASEAALAFGVNARDATHVVRVAALPRTDTGKVKREALSRQFRAEIASRQAPRARVTLAGTAGQSLSLQLGAIVGAASVQGSDTFIRLGGDSLRYIQASVVLERVLGYLPEHWERLSFSELEALPERRGRTSRVEPAILLRALAILSVVVNHTGVFEGHIAIDGAAFALLIPAGYSFGRFQLQRVIESGRATLALSLLPRIIAPTVLIVLLQQLRHREFALSPLLLYSNFIHGPGDVFSYWFIEVFVQVHLLLALALTSSWLRGQLREQAYQTSVVLVLLSALCSAISPHVWNTQHLGNLLPQFALWYFLIGWCTLFATERWQRWINSALIVGLPLLFFPGSSRAAWITFGGLFLNWAPAVNLPTPLARTVTTVASASLYIYISHFLILDSVAELLPAAGFLGQVVVALLVGVAFWFCFEKFWQWTRGLRRAAPVRG